VCFCLFYCIFDNVHAAESGRPLFILPLYVIKSNNFCNFVGNDTIDCYPKDFEAFSNFTPVLFYSGGKFWGIWYTYTLWN
jgi:hypothetical protein